MNVTVLVKSLHPVESFQLGLPWNQAMVKFEKRRQSYHESSDKFLDDLELLRRRNKPEERILQSYLAIDSKFMVGVKSNEMKITLATHFTMTDDLLIKLPQYLLIEPRTQNRYSN